MTPAVGITLQPEEAFLDVLQPVFDEADYFSSLEIGWTSGDATTYQSAVSLEDVDGDGFLEVVAGAWWGAVRIYDNDGGTVESTPSWTSEMDDIVVMPRVLSKSEISGLFRAQKRKR